MFRGSKNAFTLAEVLITLGIIGVVAAMTMPSLLNSTQGAQYRSQFKKTMSVMAQGVVLNIALDDYDLSQTSDADGDNTVIGLFRNRLNVAPGNGETWTAGGQTFGGDDTLLLNDGSAIKFDNTTGPCTAAEPCTAYIDVNGNKNPNRAVTCDNGTEGDNCTVTSPTDVFKIQIFDQTVRPSEENDDWANATKAVMYKGK